MTLDIKYYNDTTHVVYQLDSDPTVFNWGSTNAPLFAFLYRSDDGTLWMKTGPNAVDWTQVSGGGGGGTSKSVARTMAASSVLQTQLNGGISSVVIGGGNFVTVLGNLITGVGPHNNIASNLDPMDPDTHGCPYYPLAWESDNIDGSLTGVVSVDNDPTGFTTFTPNPPGYGSGLVIVQNTSRAASLTVVHESGASNAAARFDLPNGQNIVLPPCSMALFMYEANLSRWHIVEPNYT